MKDSHLVGQRGDTAARRTSRSSVSRGGTIQPDMALTLEPRPPTERPWQAALRLLARRTGWTANQSVQTLLIGSGMSSHVSTPRKEPCRPGPLKMYWAGTENKGGSKNQGKSLPREESLKQQKYFSCRMTCICGGCCYLLFFNVFTIIC